MTNHGYIPPNCEGSIKGRPVVCIIDIDCVEIIDSKSGALISTLPVNGLVHNLEFTDDGTLQAIDSKGIVIVSWGKLPV